MSKKSNTDYKIIEENDLFIGKRGDLAMTSPLLECAGLFIYSEDNIKGVLAHWQNREMVEHLYSVLSQLRLESPYAVIAGCGIPIECLSIDESQMYQEVKEFLDEERIPIRDQKVGLDHKIELEVNFSDGSYIII